MHPDPHGMTVEGDLRPPFPINEPVLSYVAGSPERAELKTTLDMMASEVIDIPVIVGGEDILTGDTAEVVMPHDHGHVLADWHRASREHVLKAVEAAAAAFVRAEPSMDPIYARLVPRLKGLDICSRPTAFLCGIVVTGAQLFAGASGPLLDQLGYSRPS